MLVVVGLIWPAVSSGKEDPSGATYHDFSVRTQTADKSLIEVAGQARTTLLFPFELAQQVVLPGIEGRFTLEQALTRLLQDSPLTLNRGNNGYLTIVPRQVEVVVAEEPLPESTKEQESELPVFERISVLGNRASARGAYDSAVPLDIIAVDSPFFAGSPTMLDALTKTVPSLNVNAQTTNDAAMLVRPANLRGLASDHTLTLINGKRRHRSAVITFLGGGLSDGAQGPDISVLPVSAIEQAEVLRDGAAAQYGSDAIAGVMNFKLKSTPGKGSISVSRGEFSAGDGEHFAVQLSQGIAVAEEGNLQLSGEYQQQQPTNRSVQRGDAQSLTDAGNLFVNTPAQVWGSAAMDEDIKLAVNLSLPLNARHQFYAFALGTRREMEGEFYYRNPQRRQGVFVSAPTSAQNLLIADLDGVGHGLECPVIAVTEQNVLNNEAFLQIAADTPLGQNCFAFNEWFPGGFTPRFGGTVKDATFYLGNRGELVNDWQYDVSAGVGYSSIRYYIHNTINPSLGPLSPTEFNPGGASQLERNASVGLIKSFPGVGFEPVTLAMGLEWRSERYRQIAGDEASYEVGPYAQNVTGAASGFSVGANGFPGYRPETSGAWQRETRAVYVDVTIPVSPSWLTTAAFRAENFSDFGSHVDGKLSARWQATELLAYRASVSSGFKAPTVGQSNIINISTKFGLSGLEDQVTLPPSNAVARQLGATPLTPEESVNVSVGIMADFATDAQLSVDFYQIYLADRISTTSAIPLDEPTIALLIEQGFGEAETYRSAKFFTNDFDTRTRGLDVVLNWRFALFGWQHELLAMLNWTDTQVTRVSAQEIAQRPDAVNLTAQRIRMLEDNLPSYRASIGLTQRAGEHQLAWQLNYYGAFYEDHLDAAAGFNIESGQRVTVDVRWLYNFTEQWKVTLGVNNLLNTQPDLNPYRYLAGAKYPPTSPGGFDGRYVFATMNVSW
ncbi:ligand-gated channel [Alteromonas lipolytica]|nr:ligand-gated channel [Alteromonas lipolytica]